MVSLIVDLKQLACRPRMEIIHVLTEGHRVCVSFKLFSI